MERFEVYQFNFFGILGYFEFPDSVQNDRFVNDLFATDQTSENGFLSVNGLIHGPLVEF